MNIGNTSNILKSISEMNMRNDITGNLYVIDQSFFISEEDDHEVIYTTDDFSEYDEFVSESEYSKMVFDKGYFLFVRGCDGDSIELSLFADRYLSSCLEEDIQTRKKLFDKFPIRKI